MNHNHEIVKYINVSIVSENYDATDGRWYIVRSFTNHERFSPPPPWCLAQRSIAEIILVHIVSHQKSDLI